MLDFNIVYWNNHILCKVFGVLFDYSLNFLLIFGQTWRIKICFVDLKRWKQSLKKLYIAIDHLVVQESVRFETFDQWLAQILLRSFVFFRTYLNFFKNFFWDFFFFFRSELADDLFSALGWRFESFFSERAGVMLRQGVEFSHDLSPRFFTAFQLFSELFTNGLYMFWMVFVNLKSESNDISNYLFVKYKYWSIILLNSLYLCNFLFFHSFIFFYLVFFY